jgi:nucleotide-binding universal stress UspA family protein
MYKTILVPLDGSDRAEKILPHVKRIAQCMGSKLVLLQIVEPSFVAADLHGLPPVMDTEMLESQIRKGAQYLNNLADQLTKDHIQSTVIVETGPVVNSIWEIARKEDADLIAMTSHGRTGIARALYGSIAAGVLHRTERPLLIIRAES